MDLKTLAGKMAGATRKRGPLLLTDREKRIFELGFMAGFNAASDAAIDATGSEILQTVQRVQKRVDGAI